MVENTLDKCGEWKKTPVHNNKLESNEEYKTLYESLIYLSVHCIITQKSFWKSVHIISGNLYDIGWRDNHHYVTLLNITL